MTRLEEIKNFIEHLMIPLTLTINPNHRTDLVQIASDYQRLHHEAKYLLSRVERLEGALESDEFYELMQVYRNAPLICQKGVAVAYEDVKRFLLADAERILKG